MRISDWSSDVCSSDLQEVAAGERAVEVDQFGAGAREFHRQAPRIGFDDLDLLAEAARERGGDFDRRALAEIVDIGLEGEAETGDARLRMLRHEHFGGADDMRRSEEHTSNIQSLM